MSRDDDIPQVSYVQIQFSFTGVRNRTVHIESPFPCLYPSSVGSAGRQERITVMGYPVACVGIGIIPV